jgi:hypothetical protein
MLARVVPEGSDPRAHPQLNEVLERASDEVGLQSYYRVCVRPLFGMPRTQWPTCCGRGCEPCSQTLIAVAERVYELLGMEQP